ncbi:MAG TPA: YqgE/AlgH family protein [Candidatus Manganitrophaceae bacterium]|nr:YqgE/AlgH family protein [Candidatus Manganitrophaceae bacterium]
MEQKLNQEIARGKLLIAMPMLNDPNFRQTVVLLCEYGSEGALGVVVNRPTEVPVSTLIDDFPNLAGTERVYAGGPVAKNGMLILCRGASEESPVVDGVFVAKDLESLKTPGALGPDGEVRCYLGYAGWSPGQLEAEIESGAWQTLPADSTLIFDADPAALWPQMMRRLGPGWAFYATMPADPNMN